MWYFFDTGNPLMKSNTVFNLPVKQRRLKTSPFTISVIALLTISGKQGMTFSGSWPCLGHKTISVFKRYNLLTEEELAQVKWPSENSVSIGYANDSRR
jgi:hypothetical protein